MYVKLHKLFFCITIHIMQGKGFERSFNCKILEFSPNIKYYEKK